MKRTGLAYSPSFLHHDTGYGHPERPERVRAIVSALQSSGTWERLEVWEPRPATEQTLELVHTPEHVASLRSLVERGGGRIDADTLASPGSWDAALQAAGGVVEAAQRVANGNLDNAFCLVRPPGHHATPYQAMGFCLFNNVAVAVASLLDDGTAQRIAILDYDVHHGNGTQDAFFHRADVLYVSTHQYPLYPGTGHWQETGAGSILNLPLPPGSGDDVYAAALQQVIEPATRRFQPHLIFVSLGFDAFWADPLAQLQLSLSAGYVPLLRSAVNLAAELCGGRLVIALEGGYDLGALGHGSDAVCRLLLGEEPRMDPLGPARDQLPVSVVDRLLRSVRDLHRLG